MRALNLYRTPSGIDSWFDEFFHTPRIHQSESQRRSWWVEEDDDHFMLSFEVPGLSKKDIKIEVKESVLYVEGKVKNPFLKKEKDERSISRRFNLPREIREDQIEARIENGILGIAIPKAEAIKPRLIEVKD